MSSGLEVRILGPDDVATLESFLAQYPDSTMFLRGNLRRAGVEDRGARFQGTYAGAYEGERLVGVVSHYWNGNVIVESPRGLEQTVKTAVAASRRGVTGILGRFEQVQQARSTLDLERAPTALEESEGLFSLALTELQVPALLQRPGVVVRAPHGSELELITRWRVAYSVEALGATETESLRVQCRQDMELTQREDRHWVLEVDGGAVAYSAFNATLPDCVQVGGVWTPPELRGAGYGRAVVAGTLVLARERGAERSVLFTGNPAAERAYRALGYRRTGDFGMVIFVARHFPATKW